MTKQPFSTCQLLIFIAFLSSCAPYTMVGGKYTADTEHFEVDLPSGWRKHEMAFDQHVASRSLMEELKQRRDPTWDVIRITRDGLLLQQIGVGRVAIDKELPHTKKNFSKELLPHELAGLIIDDIHSNPNIFNKQIIENNPAKIGGRPAFQLIYAYKTKKGLRMKTVYYGLILGDSYYYLFYEAPESYYFPKDLPTFEKVKETFQFLKANIP